MQRKQKKKKKNHIPLRMNILFFIVFILFSILILRLGVVQIVQGEEYKKEVERTDEISVSHSVPRGEIYDRTYKKVVYNIPEKAITYTPPKHPQPKELLTVAKKLAKLIEMTEEDKKKVTERDLKDIWLLENDNGNSLVTKKEKKEIPDKELYRLKLDRIKEEDLKEIDLNIASVYRKFATSIALTPSIVKNKDVTDKEYALVSEHLADLPGVDITTDWEREYTYDKTLRSILGRVEQGLPVEKLEYFRSKGYSLNDRVGHSYLEEMLEDVLQGQKTRVKTVTDKKGNVVDTKVITEGQSGKDVILTTDMELQAEVEKIIEEELQKSRKYPRSDTLDRAFVVIMNPKTGEILTLAGKQYNRSKNEFLDFAHGTFTTSYEAGSAVKGATVLTGFETGVVSPGTVLRDEVLYIKGTPRKKSVSVMGPVSDLTALERSSNVYMWKIAIGIMEGRYIPHGSLPLNLEKINTIRYYFSQFGLGVKTGIGFPNEVEGIKGKPANVGNYIDIAIGQLDTYTPLQLAQYVSTIANDGYRMKPQIVKEIRQPEITGNELGPIVEEFQPVVLNRVDMNDQYIKRVQQGFWQVTHGARGTARRYYCNEPYDMAGKTGTAQSYKDGKQTNNLSFVGYAPYNNPEMAMAVVVPNAYYGKNPYPYSISHAIGQRVARTYFDLKEKRESGIDENKNEENSNETQNPQDNNDETNSDE